MTKFLNVMRRIDDSWQGDLIGVICLYLIAGGLYFLGCAVGA